MTGIIKSPTPRRELDALDKRIYELERRINRKQTDLKVDTFVYATTVVTEQSFGQASAVGTKGTVARGNHTHGTPADPIPAHVAGTPHGGGTVTAVTASAPVVSSGGTAPNISATTGQTANTLAVGDDNRFPTANQKAAMVPNQGSAATASNPFVVGDDPRMTNARAPSGAAGGALSGSYPNPGFAEDRVRKTGDTMSGDLQLDQKLQVVNGNNNAGSPGLSQIEFAFDASPGQYRHAIKTRHNAGAASGNEIELYIWTPTDAAGNVGTKRALIVDSTGATVGDPAGGYGKLYQAGFEMRSTGTAPRFVMEATTIGAAHALVTRTETGATPAVYFAVKAESAFWQIGPAATGRRVSAGVTDSGVHQINFWPADTSNIVAASIQTKDETANSRKLFLGSGKPPNYFGEAQITLESQSTTNAEPRVLVGADLAMDAGRHLNVDGGGTSVLKLGATTRQMIDLWGVNYGIGVQSNTQYTRSDLHFAWHKGGTHSNTERSAGTGGVNLMTLFGGTTGGLTSYAGDAMTAGGGSRQIRAWQEKASGVTMAGYSAIVNGWAGAQLRVQSDLGDSWNALNYDSSAFCPMRASAFPVGSSRKTKFNIRSMVQADCLEAIKKLRPVKFNRPPITPQERRTANVSLYEDSDYGGFVAEELGTVLPEAVTYGPDMQPDAIDYAVVTAHNTGAIQALIARIEALETRLPPR